MLIANQQQLELAAREPPHNTGTGTEGWRRDALRLGEGYGDFGNRKGQSIPRAKDR